MLLTEPNLSKLQVSCSCPLSQSIKVYPTGQICVKLLYPAWLPAGHWKWGRHSLSQDPGLLGSSGCGDQWQEGWYSPSHPSAALSVASAMAPLARPLAPCWTCCIPCAGARAAATAQNTWLQPGMVPVVAALAWGVVHVARARAASCAPSWRDATVMWHWVGMSCYHIPKAKSSLQRPCKERSGLDPFQGTRWGWHSCLKEWTQVYLHQFSTCSPVSTLLLSMWYPVKTFFLMGTQAVNCVAVAHITHWKLQVWPTMANRLRTLDLVLHYCQDFQNLAMTFKTTVSFQNSGLLFFSLPKI